MQAADTTQQLPALTIDADHREIFALAIDAALAGAALAEHASGDPRPLVNRPDILLRLRDQLLEPSTTTLGALPAGRGALPGRPGLFAVTEPASSTRDLTREQERAMDREASEYGRCAVRPLADGAVEITRLLDDIEMGTVCIEPDGRERWRR